MYYALFFSGYESNISGFSFCNIPVKKPLLKVYHMRFASWIVHQCCCSTVIRGASVWATNCALQNRHRVKFVYEVFAKVYIYHRDLKMSKNYRGEIIPYWRRSLILKNFQFIVKPLILITQSAFFNDSSNYDTCLLCNTLLFKLLMLVGILAPISIQWRQLLLLARL